MIITMNTRTRSVFRVLVLFVSSDASRPLDVRRRRFGLANREIRESADHAQSRAQSRPRPPARSGRAAHPAEYAPWPVNASVAAATAVEQRHFDAVVLREQAMRPVHRGDRDDHDRRRSSPVRAARAGRAPAAVRPRSPCRPPRPRRNGRAGSPAVRRSRAVPASP